MIRRNFKNIVLMNILISLKRSFQSIWLLTILLSIGIASEISASHIVGGEISYRCLGNNRYEIKLVIRKDCENALPDADFDNPAIISVFERNGNIAGAVGINGAIFLPRVNQPILVSQNNNQICDPNFSPVCVQELTYTQEVILPRRPGGYILAHQRCCRNMTINNLITPQEQGSTYTAVISEEALNSCNQGAQFRNWAPVYICAGRQLNFDHSATDADGDSLVYRLCTPFEGASREFPKPGQASRPPYDNVVFSSGYSSDNFLGGPSANALRIDSRTGRLTAIPSIIGQFVVGVCVEEYRNGVLISNQIRDFQFNVVACGDIPTASFTAPSVQCGNLTVDFVNTSEGASYYEWLISGGGLNETIENVENLTFTFPDTGAYTVSLVAFDSLGSACKDTFTQVINLRNTGIEIDYDFQKFACGEFTNLILIDRTTDSVSTINIRQWLIMYQDTSFVVEGDSVFVQIPATVTGTITLTVIAANECERSETFEFDASTDQGLIPDFNVEIIKCEEEYRIRPIDQSRDDQGEINLWRWTLVDQQGGIQVLEGQIPGEFILNGFQNFTLTLFVSSTSGCEDEVSKELDTTPTVNFDPTFGLYASECEDRLVIDFRDESYSGPEGSPVSWNWTVNFVSGNESGTLEFDVQNFTLEFDTTTVFEITLCITYELDGEVVCENTCTTKQLFAHLLGPDHFAREVTICEGGSIELNPAPLTPNVTYRWSPAEGLNNPNIPNPIASPQSTTVYSVTITSTDINCEIVKDVTVNVTEGNDPMDFEVVNECGSLSVTFIATQGDPSVVTGWSFGDGNTGGAEGTITHVYANAGTYRVTMSTGGECPMDIIKEITIRFINLDGLKDSIINCAGEPVELFPGAPDGFNYVWTPAEGLSPSPNVGNPTATVSVTTTYSLVITDPNDPDCVISRTVTIVVPDPITLNTADLIVLCQSEDLDFEANSPTAISYTWRNGQGNVIGEGPSIVYRPTVDEIITVTVEDIFGCTVTKSIGIEFFKVVFTINGDNPMCLGEERIIEVGSPQEDRVTQYSWQPTAAIISGADTKAIRVSPTQTTTYTVQIAYEDGCILTAQYTLVVAIFPETFEVQVSRDTVLPGQQVDLSVLFVPGYTYRWEPANLIEGDNTGSSVRTVPLENADEVVFTVFVTNQFGCETEASGRVTIANLMCDEPFIFMPNTFSPNGDDVNDVLNVRVYDEYAIEVELVIYNRWGQEVFRTTDLNLGWNGTFKGKDMPVDSYGYYLRVRCIGGEEFRKQGSFNLIR